MHTKISDRIGTKNHFFLFFFSIEFGLDIPTYDNPFIYNLSVEMLFIKISFLTKQR